MNDHPDLLPQSLSQSAAVATVVSVNTNPKHGFSKQPQPSIHLIAGIGVQGDAHAGATVQHVYLKRKNPHAPNRMQVHLIASELFDELRAAGFHLDPGDLGENITTLGIDLRTLPRGTQLRIGPETIVELTCLRTPCKQIDDFRPGLQKQMIHSAAPPKQNARAGVMAVVLKGGEIKPQDAIRITLPQQPHTPLRMD